MTLKEQILEDIKHYMKEKDAVALNAVRMLKSDVKNADLKGPDHVPLSFSVTISNGI